jgi:hypothetical protein
VAKEPETQEIEVTPAMMRAGARYLLNSGFLDTDSKEPVLLLLRGALRAALGSHVRFSQSA